MTELNISHFNGLELTYIDLIANIETGVYFIADHKNDVHQRNLISPLNNCVPPLSNHKHLSCITTISSKRTTPRNTNESKLELWHWFVMHLDTGKRWAPYLSDTTYIKCIYFCFWSRKQIVHSVSYRLWK